MRSGEIRSCSSRTLIEACGETTVNSGALFKHMRNHKDTKRNSHKKAQDSQNIFASFVPFCGYSFLCGFLLVLMLPAAFAQTTPKSAQRALLDQYCVTCHN